MQAILFCECHENAITEQDAADALRQEYARLSEVYPELQDAHERNATYRRLIGLLCEIRSIEGHTGPWCGMAPVLPPWVYER